MSKVRLTKVSIRRITHLKSSIADKDETDLRASGEVSGSEIESTVNAIPSYPGLMEKQGRQHTQHKCSKA